METVNQKQMIVIEDLQHKCKRISWITASFISVLIAIYYGPILLLLSIIVTDTGNELEFYMIMAIGILGFIVLFSLLKFAIYKITFIIMYKNIEI